MTLSTHVYVKDEIDPYGVFLFCQGLLAKYDTEGRDVADQKWRNETSYRDDGSMMYVNRIGQGLPAMLYVSYRPDIPLLTEEQSIAHNKDCKDDCLGEHHRPAHWLDVDFDTSYGYKLKRDSHEWGCGDLHAMLVAELGGYLTAAGVSWCWENEFTGEIHDDPAKLSELISGGAWATDWFHTTVLPVIKSGALW